MTPQPANRQAVAISLFGRLAIRERTRSLGDRDPGAAGPRQVLEILLAARGHRVPTDRLADLLWGERLAQNAPAALQTFISVLRRRLLADRQRGRESSCSPGPMRIGSPVSWPTSTSTPSISCSSVQERPRRARRGARSRRHRRRAVLSAGGAPPSYARGDDHEPLVPRPPARRSSSGRTGQIIEIGALEMPIGFPSLAAGVESSRGR